MYSAGRSSKILYIFLSFIRQKTEALVKHLLTLPNNRYFHASIYNTYSTQVCTLSTMTSLEDSEDWWGVWDDARRLRFDTLHNHTSSHVPAITPLGPGSTPLRTLSYLHRHYKPAFMSAGFSNWDLVPVYGMVYSDNSWCTHSFIFLIAIPFPVSFMFFFSPHLLVSPHFSNIPLFSW